MDPKAAAAAGHISGMVPLDRIGRPDGVGEVGTRHIITSGRGACATTEPGNAQKRKCRAPLTTRV